MIVTAKNISRNSSNFMKFKATLDRSFFNEIDNSDNSFISICQLVKLSTLGLIDMRGHTDKFVSNRPKTLKKVITENFARY